MLIVKLDKRFKKDIQRDKKSGKFKEADFIELKKVMETLIDEKYLDHKLIGDFKGYKECHLKSNWLLAYKIEAPYIKFARLGNHRQIFKKY